MNRTMILRQLLPGLAPLLIFVLADEIWGPKIGLMVAVGFGVAELAVSLVRKQKPDNFLLLDLGLIIALGAVSIALDNDVFFKLKPVVVGLVTCALLITLAYVPGNWLAGMQQRYMPGITIGVWQQYEMKRSTGRLAWILVAHTAMVAFTALAASNAVWGMVSGPGFIVAAAIWMGWEFVSKKRNKKKHAGEEWLPLVDEAGNVVGQAPRSVVHGKSMLLHPVVHLHVVNRYGVYLQKRPVTKQVQPGKWDTAVGGHIAAGEPVDKALLRETREEIGLKEFEASLVSKYVWKSKVEHELVFSFVTHTLTPPVPSPDEVDEGRFWTFDEIDAHLGKGIFTPNFEKEYTELLKTPAFENLSAVVSCDRLNAD